MNRRGFGLSLFAFLLILCQCGKGWIFGGEGGFGMIAGVFGVGIWICGVFGLAITFLGLSAGY